MHGLEVLLITVWVVTDLTIDDLIRVATDGFEVNPEGLVNDYLVHVEEGTWAVDENWIFVTRSLYGGHRAFPDKIDILAERVGRLNDLSVLVSTVTQREHDSVDKRLITALENRLKLVQELFE